MCRLDRLNVQDALIFNSGKQINIFINLFSFTKSFRKFQERSQSPSCRSYWSSVPNHTGRRPVPSLLNLDGLKQYFSKLYLRIGAAENEEGTPFRDRCYLLLHIQFRYSTGTWACWYLWFILLIFFIFTYFKLNTFLV